MGRGAASALAHFQSIPQKERTLSTDVPYLKLDLAPGVVLSDVEVKSLGLVPVCVGRDHRLILAELDPAMSQFRQKLGAYSTQSQKVAAMAKIESVGPWSRADRLSGAMATLRIEPVKTYTVDLLLLPMEDDEPNVQGVRETETYVAASGGTVLDRSVTKSFSALRVRLGGQC